MYVISFISPRGLILFIVPAELIQGERGDTHRTGRQSKQLCTRTFASRVISKPLISRQYPFLDLRQKPEYPERNKAGMRRTWKLHTEIRAENLLAVRWRCYMQHHSVCCFHNISRFVSDGRDNRPTVYGGLCWSTCSDFYLYNQFKSLHIPKCLFML